MDSQSKGKPGNEVAVLDSKVDHDRSHSLEGKVDDTNKDSGESDNTLEVDSAVSKSLEMMMAMMQKQSAELGVLRQKS